jgi:hypothetical protein
VRSDRFMIIFKKDLCRTLRGHDLIEKRIKLARRTTYALMGTGMHGYNGINPSVIIRMWNMYKIPYELFGDREVYNFHQYVVSFG